MESNHMRGSVHELAKGNQPQVPDLYLALLSTLLPQRSVGDQNTCPQ